MTRAQLLKAYKKNNWVKIKRLYAGCYTATVQGNDTVFRIENAENRQVDGDEWLINTVSGSEHNESDPYITHSLSLTDAQLTLVNWYQE